MVSRQSDRNHFMRIRRIWASSGMALLALTVCLTVLFGKTPQALAENGTKLDLKMETGYNGKLASGKLNPVKFVLTSLNEDVSGDLVVQTTQPYGDKDVSYIKHVDLPKGVSKEVYLALPGVSYNDKNNTIRFYRESIDKGEVVPFSGADHVTATTVNSTRIGVLSEEADSFNFLALLQQQRKDVEVFRLDPAELSGDPVMLEALDVIAVNRFASETLSPEQIKAIQSWVGRGGTLILSGGASFAKSSKAFESLSPVRAQGVVSLTDLSALADYSGKPLALSEPFTISTAEPLPGVDTTVMQNGIPLLASKPDGNGRVIYAAYDVALQPLAGWNGHPDVWAAMLQDVLKSSNPQVKNGQDPRWILDNALQIFPALHTPGIGGLAISLLIYALIVAPILYILLKKWDRREWAWFLIPGIAVLMSGAIYLFGASDKMSTLANSLSVIELSGDGRGNRTTGTAVFVPNGGDYTLTVEKDVHPKIAPEQGGYSSTLNGESGLMVRYGTDVNQLGFKNIPFWSIRKIVMQNANERQLGAINGQLIINSAGALEGTVKNETVSDWTHAFVLYAGSAIPIGDLKKGESKQVVMPVGSGAGARINGDIGYMIFPPSQGNPDVNERERSLINYYFAGEHAANINRPIVLGFTADQGMDFQVDGEAVTNDQLSLWTQPLDVNIVQGNRISIPSGYVKPQMAEFNVSMMSQGGPSGEYRVADGTVIAEYRLPKIKGATYTKLRMDSVVGGLQPDVTAELWNAESKTWVKTDLNVLQTFDQKDAAALLEGGQTIKVRLTVGQRESIVRLPDISVEGEVSP